jgi:hypothetical protein
VASGATHASAGYESEKVRIITVREDQPLMMHSGVGMSVQEVMIFEVDQWVGPGAPLRIGINSVVSMGGGTRLNHCAASGSVVKKVNSF